MMQSIRALRIALAGTMSVVGLCLAYDAAAISFTFTKIADSNTLIPSGSGSFTSLFDVALDGTDVAFRGEGT